MKSTPFEGLLNSQYPPQVQIRRMRRIIQTELTDLQRQAIMGVYFQGKTIGDIARERGVNKSTVCRTLKRGEAKLKRYLQY